jgi:hypothetical protein
MTLSQDPVGVCRAAQNASDRKSFRTPKLLLGTLALLLLLAFAASAHASVALFLEEPYGRLGAFAPTGHAAVYLNHVCAEAPTRLRMCYPGEYGVVLSRYHKIHGYDWIAMPLIPYLYSVDTADEIPVQVDRDQVLALRDAYRRTYFEKIAPDTRNGKAPRGSWTQLVGASYDRAIHGFQLATTPQEDERFIAVFNDRRDISHFNFLFRNCADFSRTVINTYFPHAIHRNFIADIGLTSPKQVAKSLMAYGGKRPELDPSVFVILQVPGSMPRSHAVKGVAESLIKSKKYLLPLVILSPELTGGIIAAYLADGRMTLPKNAAVFNMDNSNPAVANIDDRSPDDQPPAPLNLDGPKPDAHNPAACEADGR